ncbi:Uncharacterised protein [Mycobacteroides abscessus subsp. abscessus]|nr:Uncharacterised protein [Mycobacteroides abscessus subsp. abscessus]
MSGATITTVNVCGPSPGVRLTAYSPDSASARVCGLSGSGSSGVSPSINRMVRRTRSLISDAFHSPHTPGPVARESASASAARSSSSTLSYPRVSATSVAVAGSSRSRLVAIVGSRRWWRTKSESTSTSCGQSPNLLPTCTASSAPTTLWSAPRPLPRS